MDAETARFLRRVIEIQLEQAELLRGLTNVEAIRQVGSHIYVFHGGNKPLGDPRGPAGIEAALDRNQRELRELVVELYKAPVSATS